MSYSKFLAANKINLKPTHEADLDAELVNQLKSISEQFAIEDLGLDYAQIIGKYFKSSHRKSESLKKKVGRNAFAV